METGPVGVALFSLTNGIAQWRKIATENGWGDEFTNGTANLTVWVNEDGTVADMVATRGPDGADARSGRLYVIPADPEDDES